MSGAEFPRLRSGFRRAARTPRNRLNFENLRRPGLRFLRSQLKLNAVAGQDLAGAAFLIFRATLSRWRASHRVYDLIAREIGKPRGPRFRKSDFDL